MSCLDRFIDALDAGAEGVYAAEWCLFKSHPDLLHDVVAEFPDYLLDDWLESIPPPLRSMSPTSVRAMRSTWRWAHQVENLGESIAVSRFYVSRENYDAAIEFFRTTAGTTPAFLLWTLMGTRAARAFFRSPDVRRWLGRGRSAAVVRRLMRRAMAPGGKGPVTRGLSEGPGTK